MDKRGLSAEGRLEIGMVSKGRSRTRMALLTVLRLRSSMLRSLWKGLDIEKTLPKSWTRFTSTDFEPGRPERLWSLKRVTSKNGPKSTSS